jgi:hypothetical protein
VIARNKKHSCAGRRSASDWRPSCAGQTLLGSNLFEAVLAAINKRAVTCTLHSARFDQLKPDGCCCGGAGCTEATWLAERKAGWSLTSGLVRSRLERFLAAMRRPVGYGWWVHSLASYKGPVQRKGHIGDNGSAEVPRALVSPLLLGSTLAQRGQHNNTWQRSAR